MEFARIFKRICRIYLLASSLTLAGNSFAGNAGLNDAPLDQPRDTVAIDTTGNLPFPFEDQPAFGIPSQDSSKLFLNKPRNINFEIEYDPETGQYIFYEKIGNLNYRLPQTMSLDDYMDYDFEKSIKDYWKQRSIIQAQQDEQGSLIPELRIGGEAFNRIFGGNTVNIQPQGHVEVSFGYQMNSTENPAIPERLRKVPTFDFDEKIQMNVMGQIGTKMNMRVNYNTEATFDYENKMNLEYAGGEDEILKRIEAGNVSLPLNGTLITGASNLFGVKAEMQFGKLSLTTLFSQHKGESQTVETEGGAQITNFDISAADYDANRHFFLSQYFRDNYDEWLENTAVPLSPVNINKIEIWVTNKSNNFDESRNIIAFQDLGEHDPHIFNEIPGFQEITGLPYPENVFPHNDANGLYYEMTNTYSEIRSIQNITSVMEQFRPGFVGGQDFEKIEQARKLSPSEYTVNERLGYVSLNSSLNSDEVLAVAFSYTSNGKVFQVGEFATDGVKAPETLVLKLLKGTSLSPFIPTWDLMMKNIYNLGANQLTSDEFILNIVYQNDSTGSYVNYLPKGRLRGRPLLEVMNLDKLNKQLDPYKDGIFDYIEGITVQADRGRIIFPVLEPFGSHLADSIQNPSLFEEYAYTSLYDSSRVDAEQDAEHNRFRLTGSFKGGSGSDIMLGALNLTEGSVKVTAGGRELIENVDYTVDYTLGRVKVINEALLEAGTPIQVSTESEDMFSMQRKSLMGAYANYAFSDNFNVGATALYMHERPLTQKVNYGEDPVSNLMVGLDGRWSTESMLLTKAIDVLPFYSTNTPSTIDLEAEVAQLIPGHSSAIEKSGNAYIDDFEGTKTSINLKAKQSWVLASTPQNQDNLFPEGNLNNSLDYGKNRAKLAWYIIDPLFLRNNSLTPDYIRTNKDLQSNHLVREVFEKEIFPAKESPVGKPTNIPVFDFAFYPGERGPYNFDARPAEYSEGVNADGSLKAPESRWGGIMREIQTSDFENSNIEFIEFWMMDPFVNDSSGTHEGGELYFNLGDISEDILKDGRKSFENGLPTSELITNVDTTIWGRISTQQSLVNAFDNDPDSRKYQDIGLDGLNSEDEQLFFEDYLNQLRDLVYDEVYQEVLADPGSDDFHYYRGSDYDDQKLGILERYKNFNGLEGNSRTTEMSPESYPTAASSIPDIEDINRDNTVNENERYYQYKVNLHKEDMQLGENYITDIKESRVELKNGQIEEVKWYRFRIPVQEPDEVVGNIRDFKSIRFLRMFAHGFKQPVVMRFATLDLIRSDWRRYTRDIGDSDASSPNAEFNVSAVNIEENGSREPVNYILPPGIDRIIDPANPQLRQLNEQSLLFKVTGLEQGDARAAYKSLYMDFRRYKRLKLEVHAEELKDYPLDDDELHFFIRIGSDYNFNYYEYEVPLKLTPPGRYNGEIESDRYAVWPDENRLDIPLEVFTNAKLDRNAAIRKEGAAFGMQDVYETVHRGWNNDKNRVKLKGNPNLGNVEVVMMGIRYKKGQVNTGPKAVEVWMNEMRLSDFDESGGWAANTRLTTRLADLGSVTVAGRTRSSGFGSLSQNINNRQLQDITEIDVASSLDLGKFFPEKAGIRLPMYYGYSRSIRSPKYNPLEPDIELEKSLERSESQNVRDSIKQISQDLVTRKSLNFTNVKVEPQREQSNVNLWDPENFSLSYSYNEIFKRNIDTEYNLDKVYRGMFSYNYSNRPELVQPFKSIGFLQKEPLKFLGDFNFYPLPTQISFRTDLTRRYHEVKARNVTNPEFVLPTRFEKDFLWNRFFDLRYDVTRSLKFDFSSRSTSRIDEPRGRINRGMDDYQMKKDSILTNLMNMGRPTLYNHNFNVSYRLPINQIQFLKFISSTVRYQGTYDWQAGPVTADTIRLGNRIQNSRNIQLTGNVNLQSLYDKVPYFQELNRKFRRTGRSRSSLNRRSGRRSASNQDQQSEPQQKEEQTYSSNVKLTADTPLEVTHNLNTKKVRVVVTGVDNKIIGGRTDVIDANTIVFTPTADAEQAKLTVSGKPGDQSFLKDMLDLTTRMLIGVRTLSVNYSLNGGTSLPGYLPTPQMFGAGTYTPERRMNNRSRESAFAPGMPFLLGWQDYGFARQAAAKGWVTMDSTLNSPYQFTENERLSLRSTVEPLPDLRIDVTANRSFSKNVSEFYNYEPGSGRFNANNFSEKGNFSMSTLTWGTAFFALGKGEVHPSEAFEDFKENRLIIARRLAARRSPNSEFGYDPSVTDPETGFPDGYGPNSVEVMVPAFLAAYQNKDPQSMSLGLFPSIKFIRPNWRIRYEGMASKIPWLKRFVSSLNFTHAYRSTYNVGSFITNLSYEEQGDGFNYVRNSANNFIAPYDFNSVNIMETFSPLINMDIMWHGDLTTRGEIKRSRNLTLSFANNQLIEILSNEYTFGMGYRFTQMDLIIKTKNSQQSYSNDLNIRADLSFRKNKTVLRRIVEDNDQITAGQSAFTIKTTADYQLSDRFQLRVFFDKVLNNPFTSLSFPTSNTNIGVSFRFTLAQ